jgi:apolipoprotein N-acyltransferase
MTVFRLDELTALRASTSRSSRIAALRLWPPVMATLRRAAASSLLRQAAAAVLSALLLASAFPAPDHGVLAWVAVVPLLVVCDGIGARRAFVIGAGSGCIAGLCIFSWLLQVPAIGVPQMTVLALYIAVYPAIWCALLPALARSRVPLVLTAPAAWVVLDYVRAHADFLALPWATLAHSQHDNLAVLQLAALTGEAGVTTLVVACNVAIAGMLLRAPKARMAAGVTMLVIAAVHMGGFVRLSLPETGPRVAVAAIQPSIVLSERDDAAGRHAIWTRLERLSMAAAAAGARIIVWPETAIADPRNNATLGAQLAALADRIDATLVVGGAETEKFMSADGDALRVRQQEKYNAAYVVAPAAPLSTPYRKQRLVPFGEYEPLADVVSWPRWLVPAIQSGVPGDVDPDPLSARGIAIGVLICWENLFADLARASAARGAQMLVQLTNDVWFGRTAASAQHNLASVLRAIENATPVVTASNTGPSQIVDGAGHVMARVPQLFTEGFAVARVPLRTHTTFYSRSGDWLVLVALSCVLLGFTRRATRHRDVHAART